MKIRLSMRMMAFAFLVAGAALVGNALYIPAKAALAQILLERAWARVQAGETTSKPWKWADMSPVAEISVPRLYQSTIVLSGVSGQAMAFAPGHMPNTPMVGERGTAVLAAHRDTHFSFLGEMVEGDVILATTADGQSMRFRTIAMRIVRADASGIDPADSGATGAQLALVTCYPFRGVLNSPLRYVVLAERIL